MPTIEIDSEERSILLAIEGDVRDYLHGDGMSPAVLRTRLIQLDAIRARRAAECSCFEEYGFQATICVQDCPKHGRKDERR